MMMYYTILLISLIIGLIYVRYVPVSGVHFLRVVDLDNRSIQVVDIREYNQSYKHPIPESINIPISYLRRNYQEIGCRKIHVIASDHLEKNMGVRLLRKKGFNVISYTIINNSVDKHQQKSA
jgi:rhodanese-related sulfurtransferase